MQIDAASTGSQFREFLSQYNKITEQCFMACIHDFTTRKVGTDEVESPFQQSGPFQGVPAINIKCDREGLKVA
ncbi:mitochondrial import inner membrane translocase subunit tim9 [Plakobranchus ocellatus]|uniref:Mitochondrial import inner membrane translocase subunit n=1 Tax=Plakobranchus ocellatus TaxID=259542 RepID=A0AAV3ZMR8_9GAST|nr:mitochondrial import inner membrane translocase subunit tim9 [Plakobranchus ocellatus]